MAGASAKPTCEVQVMFLHRNGHESFFFVFLSEEPRRIKENQWESMSMIDTYRHSPILFMRVLYLERWCIQGLKMGWFWEPSWGALLLLVVPVKARPLRPGCSGFYGFSWSRESVCTPGFGQTHPDIEDDIGWYWTIHDRWISYLVQSFFIVFRGGAQELSFAVLIVVCCALLHLQRLLKLPPGLHFSLFLALPTNWTRWFLTEINTWTECCRKSVGNSSIPRYSIYVAGSYPNQSHFFYLFFAVTWLAEYGYVWKPPIKPIK